MRFIKLASVIAAATAIFFVSESQALNLYIQQTVNVQMWQFGSSYPANNQSFDAPPSSVTINFSVAPRPDGSSIKVYDPYGNQMTTSNPVFNGSSMTVNLPPFKEGYAGTYRVEWTAYCQCNDPKMLGNSYYFNIR